MLEQMKSVSNPLTIIALFAALAEIAGTVAIKLVAPELQSTFIWFVMIFPTLIVVLFFVTLNFNPHVLYAPGDYKNEENYLAAMNAKQSLGIEKVETMIATARNGIISDVQKMIPNNGAGDQDKVEKIVNEKFQPVQAAVENIKSEPARSFLSAKPQTTEAMMTLILRTLYEEGKPLTANEIANKNRVPITLLRSVLAVLAEMKIVDVVVGEDGKARFMVNESDER